MSEERDCRNCKNRAVRIITQHRCEIWDEPVTEWEEAQDTRLVPCDYYKEKEDKGTE